MRVVTIVSLGASAVLGLAALFVAKAILPNAAKQKAAAAAAGQSQIHGVPVVDHGNALTYSFQMNCQKIQSLCGAPRPISIAERCERFRESYHPELQAAS